MNELTPEEIKALRDRDKVIYSRAVKLGLVVDVSEAERKLTPTLKALQDKVKGLSDSIDKEHPLFSKSKLGHTMTALSGFIKGIKGSEEGLNSAYKSLDKLGLGWVGNTSNMIKWAIAAKNNKELGKELYDNMGLLGKAIVNVSEFLGKKVFKIDFNLDESEADKKLREQKAELEEVIKKKKETLDAIEGLYKESADSRLQIIKDTIQKEIDLLNESPLLKGKPPETESKTQVSKKLQESEQIKNIDESPINTEVDENILKQKRELLDQLSSMYKESGDNRLKVLTDQVQSELDVLDKISAPKKLSPVEIGDETQTNLSKLQDGIDSVDTVTKSLGKSMNSTESAASKALGNIAKASEGTSGSLAGTANTAAKLGATTETSMAGATRAMAMFGTTAAVASAGILLVVGALAAIVVGFMKVTEIAILARDEMVKFDRVFGGIGETSLFEFRKQLNGISDDLGHLGVTTEVVNDIVHKYLTSGISLARSTSSTLVGATKEIAEITGQSTEAIGGFFSNLIKKVNLSDNSLKQLSTSFINYNKAAYAVKGVAISFDLFKESIESSTNALMIAKSKGESFVKAMSSDLASLAGLASTIGLNVSELNSRFEEAGNLINNMSSGFRSLLIISGGTNIDQMMSNTFDKTEAILKISEYIQNLNTQFGGNLNITSQVVSQIGGISKEMALQLARLTTEERRRMSDMIKFKQAMKDDTVTDSFNKITNNLTAAWDKVKAAFINVFQKAITNSEVLSKFVEKLSNLANYLRDQLTGESMSDFMKGMTNIIDKIAGPFSKLVDKVKDFVVDLGDPNKSWLSSLWELIKSAGRAIVDILLESASQFGTLVMRGMLLAAGRSGSLFGKTASEIAEGDLKAEGISVETLTKQNFDYLGGKDANILDAATIANNANLMAKQQYDEILKKRISDIESENARKPKATQTEQKVSQVTTQENQQKQKEVEALNKLTSSLDKNISWNEDLIKSYTNLGLVDTDIAYGRTFDKNKGEWSTEEGFMSVGQRKEQLQKEIEYREKEKIQLIKDQNATMLKVQAAAEKTNELLKIKINGKEELIESVPVQPPNRPAMVPEDVWRRAKGTS